MVSDPTLRGEIATLNAFEKEIERLRRALEIIAQHDTYTKLHPDGTAPAEVQNAYSEGVTDGYRELAVFARKALTEQTNGQ